MHEILLITTPHTTPLGEDSAKIATERLPRTKERSATKSTVQVDPLSARSLGKVYLAPTGLLASPDWSALRTRLAAANRNFIMIGPELDSAVIVEACRDGAFDVLDHGDSPSRWATAVAKAVESQTLWWQLYGGQASDDDQAGLIGRTPTMSSLRLSIQRLGPTRASVLILGESGTGKERVADALHAAGGTGDFVAFNCAAVPAELLEAELFGVNKGAFTGAHNDRPGLVEQADGGTLFLDEIGEMAPTVQAKLLRFLETRSARRLGSNQDYQVDLRIVAATNRDLDVAMQDGTFRPDLYYRLAEVTLRLVPLRERLEDVALLARHFLDLAGTRFGKFYDSIEPELVVKLQAFNWPGNVRELKSAIDRLVLMHDGPVLRAGWWDAPIPSAETGQPAPGSSAPLPTPRPAPPLGHAAPVRTRHDRLRRARELLAAGTHSQAEVAAELGVHPSTLFRWRQSGKI